MSKQRRHLAAEGWTTSARLRTLVFGCWAMLLVVCLAAVGSLALQSEQIRRLTLVDVPAVDANNQVYQAMTDAQTGLVAYQASGDRALLQPYFGAYERTMAALARLQALSVAAVDSTDTALHRSLRQRQRADVDQWWADAHARQRALDGGRRADLFQNRALFTRYAQASSALGKHLTTDREQTQLSARTLSSRGEVVSIAATLAALLGMLVLGRRVAATISGPLTELRDTMVRQRGGEPGARAREDQGSQEMRSVAADFNVLTEQNLALLRAQEHDLDTHQITLQIARKIRAAPETQQAMEVMCAALGKGLGADRVMANTLDGHGEVTLHAQWHGSNLQPLSDLRELLDLGAVPEQLWLSTGFRAEDDLLSADPPAEGRLFIQRTGARGAIVATIGLDDRVIGVIHVLMVGEPRPWSLAEVNVVQAVAGFMARAIVGAEHQVQQREHVRRIERLDRQKSDFLATVSHELRTPLTSISGYLEILQEDAAEPLTPQQDKMLEVIGRNTARLRSLIEDVMVLSRIEGGVNKADFALVSISSLVTRAVEELSLFARTSGVELEVKTGPRAAMVLGDRASLDRAVVNILANAIKFSHRGGVVTIGGTVDLRAHRAFITCHDQGFGIPAHDLPDLFTRFFRASNATDQAIPGTGLGLSIARQIIEEHHGGELQLTSVEGEWTTVILCLPMDEQSSASQTPAGGAAADGSHLGNESDSEDVFGIRA